MTLLQSAERFTETAQPSSPWRRRLVVAAVVLLVAAAVWVVWFSSLLTVKEVRVLGTDDVSVEEVLAAVGDRPELGEPEESGRPLDRVDGAEDARQPLGVAGILLQRDEVPVELVEILGRLDEELPHVFFVVVHAPTVPAGDRRHASPHSDTIHRGFGGLAYPSFLP